MSFRPFIASRLVVALVLSTSVRVRGEEPAGALPWHVNDIAAAQAAAKQSARPILLIFRCESDRACRAFDAALTGADSPLMKMAGEYVFARQTKMNGVDLKQFEFDYDVTWFAFLLNADGHVLARYGGRDETSADARLSVEGLLGAMRQALKIHRESKPAAKAAPAPADPETPESIPTMDLIQARYEGNNCIRCHMINDARRSYELELGGIRKESLWSYPPPERIGIELDRREGNIVSNVLERSAAQRAGIQPGDVVTRVGSATVLTAADIQFALNRAPASGRLEVEISRNGRPRKITVNLTTGWNRWDVSWRKSIRELSPRVGFEGAPLSASQRESQRIRELDLAYRVAKVEPGSPADRAGIKAGDVIVAVNGKRSVPYRQFQAYFPLEHKSGDGIRVILRRGSQSLSTTIELE